MSSTNHQYRIDLPEGWTDGTLHVFQSPEEEGHNHEVLLQIDEKPESKDLEEYARPRIDSRLSSRPDFETIQDEAITLPDGTAAHAWVAKFTSADDQVHFQRQIYLVRDGRAYTLTGVFTKKTLKTLASGMFPMAASLRAGK